MREAFFRIFMKKILTSAFFLNNRKNIHNFLKYIASTWIVPSFIKIYYFVKSYETFLLFNLASIFLCFGTTMCHFILETTYCHLIGWSTKKNLFWKGVRNLKNHMTKIIFQGGRPIKMDYKNIAVNKWGSNYTRNNRIKC